jgi:hypothetical protein
MKRAILLIGSALALSSTASCGDPLNDYGACVKIETARCALREKCDPTFDLDTCKAYYAEYCRTREIDGPDGKNATAAEVQSCVDAIGTLSCSVLDDSVDETDLLTDCSFLWPKEDEDASAGDTDDTDTGTDTADAG